MTHILYSILNLIWNQRDPELQVQQIHRSCKNHAMCSNPDNNVKPAAAGLFTKAATPEQVKKQQKTSGLEPNSKSLSADVLAFHPQAKQPLDFLNPFRLFVTICWQLYVAGTSFFYLETTISGLPFAVSSRISWICGFGGWIKTFWDLQNSWSPCQFIIKGWSILSST